MKEIQIVIEIDEPIEKIKKRVLHMVSKWPTLSKPVVNVSEV
jgi:hypothetical protein